MRKSRLVLGIISIALSVLMFLISAGIGLGTGIFTCMLLLAGGILNITAYNSKKTGLIMAAMILYISAALFGIVVIFQEPGLFVLFGWNIAMMIVNIIDFSKTGNANSRPNTAVNIADSSESAPASVQDNETNNDTANHETSNPDISNAPQPSRRQNPSPLTIVLGVLLIIIGLMFFISSFSHMMH